MAILHFRLFGPAQGSSAVRRFEYLSAELPHSSRGGVERVESGNLPGFAEGSARVFWRTADEQERMNGRLFNEIEAALPSELSDSQNEELARDAVRDFFGDAFPYTMAIHSIADATNRTQRHMHAMFCARPVTEDTALLPAERFFKRNGAKKDRTWNDRTKPYALRCRWCDLLNISLAKAGFNIRLSPGKKLDDWVEPKILGMDGRVNSQAADQVKQIRNERRSIARLTKEIQREMELKIAAIEAKRDAELRKLDELAASL